MDATDEQTRNNDAAQQDAPATDSGKRGKKRSLVKIALMLVVPLAMIAGGVYYWITSSRYISTDNAYVQQDKVAISPEVAGRIIEVAVKENQRVQQGDLLFRIDPAPYRLAVEQASAEIAAAQVNLHATGSDAEAASVEIKAADEDIRYALFDLERQQKLMQRGFTTRTRLEEAEHKVAQAREHRRSAVAAAAAARARLATGSAAPGQNPDIARAKADRDNAALNLSRTEVYAPKSGRAVQTDRLQVGQMMVTGLPVVTIVEDGSSWIEANFKETDLAKMRIGQSAEIRVDAYPDLVLKGVVESFGGGTGSEFSVLPAQNATGNWVKVTQRIPVRIRITEKSPRQLIAGMSVEVIVDSESKPAKPKRK